MMSKFDEFLEERKEKLKRDMDREEEEDQILWGGVFGAQRPKNDLSNSENFKQIIAILHEDPILVQPTLAWLRKMQSDVARAKLEALYSQEELEIMYASVHEKQ